MDAGEAVQCLEKARQIAAAVHGRDHPILESFWEALAEAKKEVSFAHQCQSLALSDASVARSVNPGDLAGLETVG